MNPFEEPQPSFTVKEVETSLEQWVRSPFLSEGTRNRLLRANVLLVPDEGRAGEGVRYFPSGTTILYDFLNEHKTEDLVIDACIEEEDYKELSLRSDLLIIAGIVVSQLVAPIIVNLISDFISTRMGKRKEKGWVKSKLTVSFGDGRAIQYEYDGPATEYSVRMSDALSKINNLSPGQLLELLESNQRSADSIQEDANILSEVTKPPRENKRKGKGKRKAKGKRHKK